MLVAFLIGCLAAPALSATYFVVDEYANPTSCLSKGIVETTVLSEVGVCIDVGMTLPEPLSAVKSFKLDLCENGAEYLSLGISGFTEAGCGGIGIPYTLNDMVPAGCHKNAVASCQTDPIALSERWPNVAVFVNDDTCANTLAVLAARPGCNSYQYDSKMYSMSTNCIDPATLHAVVYNDTLDCTGGSILKEVSLPTNTCTFFAQIPIPTSPALAAFPLAPALNITLGDLLVDGYYMASCSGGY